MSQTTRQRTSSDSDSSEIGAPQYKRIRVISESDSEISRADTPIQEVSIVF